MAAGGDGAAFETLVHRHYGDCLRYAMRLLGARHDAEEVVQDTFVRAHRSLPRYENRDRFRAWLFRILVNRCRSAATAAARRQARMAAYASHHPTVEPPPSPDAERLARIQAALRQLPVRQREAFLLKHVEDLSYEEMAALSGQRVSTLKMRVKRARERLQLLLKDVYDD
jgi:RNA polymerase sigma-70 factor (ECF subfamily)